MFGVCDGRGLQSQSQTWPAYLCKGWVRPLRQSFASEVWSGGRLYIGGQGIAKFWFNGLINEVEF